MESVNQGTFCPSSYGNRKFVLYVLFLRLEVQQSLCQRKVYGNIWNVSSYVFFSLGFSLGSCRRTLLGSDPVHLCTEFMKCLSV